MCCTKSPDTVWTFSRTRQIEGADVIQIAASEAATEARCQVFGEQLEEIIAFSDQAAWRRPASMTRAMLLTRLP
jgi:hypothetical protein